MRVNVDEQAIHEPRIRRMARRLSKTHGRTIHHTEILGRLIGVWMLCYSRRSPVLRADDVDITADLDGFADAMVSEEMGDTTHAENMIHVRGVSDRIAFLERQSERGKRGGHAPRETTQSRLFADDEALAKRVLERTQANAKRAAERTPSERLRSPQANSPAPDLDLAPDLAPDHVPRRGTSRPENGNAENPSQLAQDDAKGNGPADTAPEPEDAPQRKPAREVADQAVTLAHLLMGTIIANHPTGRIAKAPQRVKDATALRWAEPIDKLQRLDGMTWGEIEGMIMWCQRDTFWRGVILGGDNLRDKWDTMAAQRSRPARGGGAQPRKGPTELALEEVRELEAIEQAQERAKEQTG